MPQVVLFCHSILSDWNHGNAHFLRGVATEFIARGYDVRIFEPADSWSMENLLAERGQQALEEFRTAYPGIHSERYHPASLDLDQSLAHADLVLVHEWNSPDLIRFVGLHRKRHGGYRLFFHDSHHRSATAPDEMARFSLEHYDGVLAFGSVIRDLYRKHGWSRNAWTWHEAADTRVFRPIPSPGKVGDLVWIGNWGDEERTRELNEFLIEPVEALGLKAKIYGVRYPADALRRLERAGIEYGGYLPNYRAPEVYSQYRMTVHVPRGPYARALPGIPTIRVFEALACGVPLFSAPWQDSEHLFEPDADFSLAGTGEEMTALLQRALENPDEAQRRARCGFEMVTRRHTCAHRVDELLTIVRECQ